MQIYVMGSASEAGVVPPGLVWICVYLCTHRYFIILHLILLASLCRLENVCVTCVWRGSSRGRTSRTSSVCEAHKLLCVFVKRRVRYQSVFTSPRLVRYEGRAALPHPPVNITWTHISSQPSLKCCELRRSSRRNPNIRRLLAVRSGGAIWGQTLQWIVVTSNNQRGAYWRPNV